MPDKIAEKLKFLIRSFQMSESEFAAAFEDHFETRQAVVLAWLARAQDAQGGSLKKLTTFWLSYVPTLTTECWSKDQAAFETQVRDCIAGDRTLNFLMPVKLHRLEQMEVRVLPGKYRIFRYAYKNSGEVALEWLLVDDVSAGAYVRVRLYSVSVNDIRQIPAGLTHSVPSANDQTEPAYELFEGRLYRLGDAYVGLLAYKDGAFGVRSRTLEFATAERGKVPEEWWGLLTGIGARSRSPSCTTVVAERHSTVGAHDYELTDAELKDVRYGQIKDVPEKYRIGISNSVGQLPDKNVGLQDGDSDFVLIAGRRRRSVSEAIPARTVAKTSR